MPSSSSIAAPNVSPAPMVSATCTGTPGSDIRRVAEYQTAPSAPRVTTTAAGPSARSRAAASSSDSPGYSASRSSSDALTMSLRATVASTVFAIGGPTPVTLGRMLTSYDVVLVGRSRAISARTSSQPGVSTAPSEQACTASGGSDTWTVPIRQSMSNV